MVCCGVVRQSVRCYQMTWTSFVTGYKMVSHGPDLDTFDDDPVPVITNSVLLRRSRARALWWGGV